MDDKDNINDIEELEDENEIEQKKKKKKGEGDSQRVGEISVTEGFYSYMTGIGASPSLIANILKSWSHLRGQGLMRAISDFIKGVSTRATAHVQVDIGRDKGFTLLHNLIEYFKSVDSKAPTQTHTQRMNQSNRFDPK
ncbi:MAG: hypothetical protein AB7E52_00925 [Bdellovibrionales bacterium]